MEYQGPWQKHLNGDLSFKVNGFYRIAFRDFGDGFIKTSVHCFEGYHWSVEKVDLRKKLMSVPKRLMEYALRKQIETLEHGRGIELLYELGDFDFNNIEVE